MNPFQVIETPRKRLAVDLVRYTGTFLFFVSLFAPNCFSYDGSQAKGLISFEQISFKEGIIDRIYADFDGDGNEECLETGGEGVTVNDFDDMTPKTAYHLVGTLDVRGFQAIDITGDPSPEIFTSIKEGNKTWLQIWEVKPSFGGLECSPFLKTVSVSGLDISGDGEWDGFLGSLRVSDLNDDGQKDIIVEVHALWDLEPRGIVAFDGKTGEIIWEFLTAGGPSPPVSGDLNSDGQDEILFSACAPSNGKIIGDMNDWHSYLICLNRKGELLWRHEMGGVFSSVQYTTGDIDQDGEIEIVCTYMSGDHAKKTTHFELQIRSGKTGESERFYRLPTSFLHPFLADMDRDGRPEVVVPNDNGFIYVLDDMLVPLRMKRFGTALATCHISEIVDIDQDGNLEIIASSANRLLVLDSNLELLGEHQTAGTIRSNTIHFFAHPHYGGLISFIQGTVEKCRSAVVLQVMKAGVEWTGPLNLRNSTVFVFLIFGLGIAAAVLVLRFAPAFAKRMGTATAQRKEERRDSLLETLSAFGHGKTATANLDRLSLLFKNLPRNQLPSLEYRKKIDESVDTYLQFTSSRLSEIIKKSSIAEIDKEHTVSLKENLKQLTKILGDLREREMRQDQVEKLSQEVPAVIESLEENTRSIESELSHYYGCDIVTTVQEVLGAVSSSMKKEKIEFRNLHVEGDVGVKAFISESDLATVFEELINNAIHSMKETSKKEIAVKITIGGRKITVEVADTGCGINKDNFGKIFDREYSTKKEGGFGLYHAKALLNKYGGKIKAVESELGVGTTMQVEVRRT